VRHAKTKRRATKARGSYARKSSRYSRHTAKRRKSPVRAKRRTARPARGHQRITLVIRHEAGDGSAPSPLSGARTQTIAIKRASL
jgi:hypothetical protein